MRSNSYFSNNGTIPVCATVIDHVTNFSTLSTITMTSGYRTHTSSCTVTSRILSYRSTLRCGYIATAPSTTLCGISNPLPLSRSFSFALASLITWNGIVDGIESFFFSIFLSSRIFANLLRERFSSLAT